MINMEIKNQTEIAEFILLGFGDLQNLQIPLFLLFLLIYILTMAGNLLIVVLIVSDQHLHTPMYFFLGNLSCLEVCYSSTILPRMLVSFLSSNKVIFFRVCIMQYFFFGGLAGTECYLLSVMSYDRYLAICKPLHYAALMNSKLCRNLVCGSWSNGFLVSAIVTLFMSQLHFCGPNVINHFFCDSLPILKLSCSNTQLVFTLIIVLCSGFTIPPFFLTLASYVCIISKILKISSKEGRQKTFSTCSSHLTVVAIFYGSLVIVYMLPKTNELMDLNKIFSAGYTIVPPLLNPLIYSLRNQEVKKALRRVLHKCWR
ncbi:olfactory receptor 5B21-like [Varanus komodoensis]|uniref:olfactory receptor 5B21-like n=1 Tax=Varanus komodoensis TaxID=61221 RepID=UPI001CF77DE2|nr:olfactory receptor 5B21-like [Varanus komodoensis]